MKNDIGEARSQLMKAHHELVSEKMNVQKIDKVRRCNEDVIKWNDLKEKVLKQREKIELLKSGDGNNSYFHASLKAKQNANCMNIMHKEDDTMVTTPNEIEQVVLVYYGNLMGKGCDNLHHIDIISMRDGA